VPSNGFLSKIKASVAGCTRVRAVIHQALCFKSLIAHAQMVSRSADYNKLLGIKQFCASMLSFIGLHRNKRLLKLVLCGTFLYRIGGERLKGETQGGFLISQIKQISARIFEKLLVNAGVEAFNGAQGRILYVLWQGDGIPIVELSRKTGLAKTTLTSMLDRMENANLITRVFDKADRRQIRIALTETARELNDEYNRVSREMSEIYYAGFSDDEIAAFETALRRIIKNLNERENQV